MSGALSSDVVLVLKGNWFPTIVIIVQADSFVLIEKGNGKILGGIFIYIICRLIT